MYNGMINVYKEAGYTSHDVVAKLRGICGQKKIGHTGTLDPDAVGVLPVCLGNGTRLCGMLTDRHKEYIARLRLGVVTDTQDISGKILEEREKISAMSFNPQDFNEKEALDWLRSIPKFWLSKSKVAEILVQKFKFSEFQEILERKKINLLE